MRGAAFALAFVLFAAGCLSNDIRDVEDAARKMPLVDGARLRSLSSQEGGILSGTHATTTVVAAYPGSLDPESLARGQANTFTLLGWFVESQIGDAVVASKGGFRASCDAGAPHSAGPEGVRDDEDVLRCVVSRS